MLKNSPKLSVHFLLHKHCGENLELVKWLFFIDVKTYQQSFPFTLATHQKLLLYTWLETSGLLNTELSGEITIGLKAPSPNRLSTAAQRTAGDKLLIHARNV